MANDSGKPPFSFAQVLTEPLLQGMPGTRQRLARRRSWVTRFLQRYFRRSARNHTPEHAAAVESLAAAGKAWRTSVRAYKSGRLDSLIRCITSLRQTVEKQRQEGGDMVAQQQVDTLTRRAWNDVKPEMNGRLLAVDERLDLADSKKKPENFYWMETTLTPEARSWDTESIEHLAEEVRAVYGRLVWAKGNLKFLALHIDDLRWLADYGAGAAEALTAVPTNRTLKQKINRADAQKRVLNDHVSRILKTGLGEPMRRILRPDGR
ncbi:MAG: hypothetical protein V3T05_04990 [Myxococcota bacterium]